MLDASLDACAATPRWSSKFAHALHDVVDDIVHVSGPKTKIELENKIWSSC